MQEELASISRVRSPLVLLDQSIDLCTIVLVELQGRLDRRDIEPRERIMYLIVISVELPLNDDRPYGYARPSDSRLAAADARISDDACRSTPGSRVHRGASFHLVPLHLHSTATDHSALVIPVSVQANAYSRPFKAKQHLIRSPS